ncbi:VPLPA-CTERM sorting domain-containing protein [Primorskyibacter sp. 2E107]|uniref:VPLPA-CTERM sorting domain-containing protein n=1 Tax=Primorskyibacter sp. 2E107 TaxID=3403458 RepID=UPI003AF9A93F
MKRVLMAVVFALGFAAPVQALVFGDGDSYSASFNLLDYDAGAGAQVLPSYNRIGSSVGFLGSNALDTGEQAIIDVTYGSGETAQFIFSGTSSGLLGISNTQIVAPYAETTGTVTITAMGSFDLSALSVISKGNLSTGGVSLFSHSVFDDLSIAAVPLPAGTGLLLMALGGLGLVRRQANT